MTDDKTKNFMSIYKKLEEDLQELEKEKIKMVYEAFDCVETLQKIALNTDSVFTLLHIDDLIEKLKEINESEKVQTLETIKKKAGDEKHAAMDYTVKYINRNNAPGSCSKSAET